MNIYNFDILESTSKTARDMLKNSADYPLPFFVIANEQSGGKGRMGRKFFSPAGSGIYLTAAFKQVDLPVFSDITMRAALAVCFAIEAVFELQPQIKWVNDIYLGNKKVCGILAESVENAEKEKIILLGIGINCNITNFPDELKDKAASIADFAVFGADSKEKLIDGVINQILNFEKCDIVAEYKARSLLLGKKIKIVDKSSEYCAFAIDIADNGGLIIEKADNSIETLISGDISVSVV